MEDQVLALKLWLKHHIDLFDLKLNKWGGGGADREREGSRISGIRLL